MVNEVIDGVVKALAKEFKEEGYEIYTENVEQGMNIPCFFVLSLNPKQNRERRERYKSENLIMIHYFPSSTNGNFECNEIMGRLFECLEFISLKDDMIMGSEMDAEVRDKVLQFKVKYDFYTYRTEEKTKMTSLDMNIKVKEENDGGEE